MKKRLLFLPIALLLVFAMVACGPKEPGVTTPSEEVPPEIDEPVVELPEEPDLGAEDDIVSYADIILTPMEAYDLYSESYPDMQVTEIELDKYFGSYVYKIKGYKENEEIKIKLNPVNGDIIDTDTEIEMDSDKDGEITKVDVEKIQSLVDKSLVDAGTGSMVDEWTLQWDDGVLEFEIEIDLVDSKDIEYTYNVLTGELIEKD